MLCRYLRRILPRFRNTPVSGCRRGFSAESLPNRHSHCTVNSSIILCDLRCSFPLIRRRPRLIRTLIGSAEISMAFSASEGHICGRGRSRKLPDPGLRSGLRLPDTPQGIVTAVDRHADTLHEGRPVRKYPVMPDSVFHPYGQQVCAALGHGAAEALDGLERKVRIQVDDVRLNHFTLLDSSSGASAFSQVCFLYMVRCNLFCFHFHTSIFHICFAAFTEIRCFMLHYTMPLFFLFSAFFGRKLGHFRFSDSYPLAHRAVSFSFSYRLHFLHAAAVPLLKQTRHRLVVLQPCFGRSSMIRASDAVGRGRSGRAGISYRYW